MIFIKDSIAELKKEREELKNRLSKVDILIDTIRELCSHEDESGESTFKYDGHDSHYDYYKCTQCGETNKV